MRATATETGVLAAIGAYRPAAFANVVVVADLIGGVLGESFAFPFGLGFAESLP